MGKTHATPGETLPSVAFRLVIRTQGLAQILAGSDLTHTEHLYKMSAGFARHIDSGCAGRLRTEFCLSLLEKSD